MIKHIVKIKEHKHKRPYWSADCSCGWAVTGPTEQAVQKQVTFHIKRDHRDRGVTTTTQGAML